MFKFEQQTDGAANKPAHLPLATTAQSDPRSSPSLGWVVHLPAIQVSTAGEGLDDARALDEHEGQHAATELEDWALCLQVEGADIAVWPCSFVAHPAGAQQRTQ